MKLQDFADTIPYFIGLELTEKDASPRHTIPDTANLVLKEVTCEFQVIVGGEAASLLLFDDIHIHID